MECHKQKISVQALRPEQESSYSEYVERSREATIYHTLAWRDISCRVFGHKPYYLIAEEDGNIRGVLPLLLVNGLLGRRLVSLPLRDKGGPLYDNHAVLASLLEAAKNMMIERKCRYLQLKTWHGIDFQGSTPEWVIRHDHFINSSIVLDKNPEAVWSKLHKRSVQRPIRKSKREGVTCYWSTSLEDMKQFYRLLILTRKKLGVPPYGFELFYAIWENMILHGSAGLILADYKGIIISGMIIFFYQTVAMPGYAASDKKYLDLRPNNLLFWEAIKNACERGCTCFDFGADSPDNPTLLSFKERFGAVKTVLPHYYIFNGPQKSFAIDFDSRKYRLQRKLFARLPLFISRRIGPVIVRQLS